jgi:prepilin-type N-terminal cleavage/methylation domain-containing protein
MNSTSSLRSKNKRGMTLVEVLLGAAILSILSIAAVTSLFFPLSLVIASGQEQTAIHAGIADIERHLHDVNDLPGAGIFTLDGASLTGADILTTATVITEDPGGDPYRYLLISNTVTFLNGKTVELVTYRSLEIISSRR